MLRQEPNLPSLPAATHSKGRSAQGSYHPKQRCAGVPALWQRSGQPLRFSGLVFFPLQTAHDSWPPWLEAVPCTMSQDQPLLCLCGEASCFTVLNWLQNNSWCESKTLYDALLTSARPSIPTVLWQHRSRSAVSWDLGIWHSKWEFWALLQQRSGQEEGKTPACEIYSLATQLGGDLTKCPWPKQCLRAGLHFILKRALTHTVVDMLWAPLNQDSSCKLRLRWLTWC